MLFTWMDEQGRDESAGSTFLHVVSEGRQYLVVVSDEAKQDLGLPRCKVIAQGKIANNPAVKRIEVVSTDR